MAKRPQLGMPTSSSRFVDGAEYKTSTAVYDDAYRPLDSTVALPAVGDLGKIASRTFTTGYTYTADGQQKTLVLPRVTTAGASGGTSVLGQETVTTYYDTASQPTWAAGGFGWGTYVAHSRVNSRGQTVALDLGNTYGAYVTREYDDVTGRLESTSLQREQITGSDLAVSYSYDAVGNVTSVFDQPTNTALGAQRQDNQCFGYDGLRRLTLAWTPTDSAKCSTGPTPALVGGAAPYWTDYGYDALGNRTTTVDHTGSGSTSTATTAYAYSSASPHQLTKVTKSVDGAAAAPVASFAYDGAGNQTGREVSGVATQVLGWNAEGTLAQVSVAGQEGVGEGEGAYVYDASGTRLVAADEGGTTVYLPGGQELRVDHATGAVSATRYYSFAGEIVAVRTSHGLGGVASLVNDPHGTPLAAIPNTTWTATSVTKQYTNPFGARRGSQDTSVPGTRQFLGKTRDEATSLTLLEARYYDELVGRFVSVDPKLDPGSPAQFNGYVYSGNNPLTWSDPTGLSWLSKAWHSTTSFVSRHSGEIVGAAAGAATFGGCMVATAGAGSIGCAAAGGAVGGAVTNLWKSKVQHTQVFSWRSLALDTVIGAAVGAAAGAGGAAASRFVAPIAKKTTGAVSSAVSKVAPKASTTLSKTTPAANTADDVGSATNKIFSNRVLQRSAEEGGPFHNFPTSFDDEIFSNGTKTTVPNYFNKAKPNLSNDSIQYRLPGELNGRAGTYEIFTRPSLSGRNELIMHRFFRPDC